MSDYNSQLNIIFCWFLIPKKKFLNKINMVNNTLCKYWIITNKIDPFLFFDGRVLSRPFTFPPEPPLTVRK